MTGPPWDQLGADPAGDVREFMEAAERLGHVRRCECCDLPVESCGKEIERKRRAEAAVAAPTAGVWFPAKYQGVCSGCGDDFNTGDRIALASVHGLHHCYVAECCKELADA